METSVVLDFLGDLQRTHMCGDLRASHAGQTVLLMGWAHRRRDHGAVIFIDMRDRTGHTQAIFHEDVDPAVHQRAEEVRAEYVIAVEGVVALRSQGNRQPEYAHRRSGGGGVARSGFSTNRRRRRSPWKSTWTWPKTRA